MVNNGFDSSPNLLDRATIVGFYNNPASPLDGLASRLQEQLRIRLSSQFRPRLLSTVHFTILGLDEYIKDAPQDLPGLAKELLRRIRDQGLCLQYGGFKIQDYHGFTSRGRSLYERSFSISNGQATLIGWPVKHEDDRYQPDSWLAEFRKTAENYGFRHKYHNSPDDSDPDAYVVVGEITDLAPTTHAELEEDIRRFLSEESVLVQVSPADVSLVLYTDRTLPKGSQLFALERIAFDDHSRESRE